MAARFPQIDWRVTAGNSSPINDGSAAVLITTPALARELGLEPKARLHTFAVVGDDPLVHAHRRHPRDLQGAGPRRA